MTKQGKFRWLLVLIIFTIMALAGLFVIGISDVPSAKIHPDFTTMLQGNPAWKITSEYKWFATSFGILIISLFVIFVYIGLDNKQKPMVKRGNQLVLIGGLIYVFVFIMLVLVSWQYDQNNSHAFFAGFPVPTALLLYGLVGAPIFFTILYIFKFSEWIISTEELEHFNRIVQSRKKKSDSPMMNSRK